MCAAACSTTGLSEVAMTPFVPHFSAFIGACMYLGLYAEPRGFVLCFHFFLLLCYCPCPLSPPHLHIYCLRLHGVFHSESVLCVFSDHLHWFQMKPCCFLHSPSLALTSVSFPLSEFHPHRLATSLSFTSAAMSSENMNVMFWTLTWDSDF